MGVQSLSSECGDIFLALLLPLAKKQAATEPDLPSRQEVIELSDSQLAGLSRLRRVGIFVQKRSAKSAPQFGNLKRFETSILMKGTNPWRDPELATSGLQRVVHS
jgi:hypothetical protein